jgi:hypothetical protein
MVDPAKNLHIISGPPKYKLGAIKNCVRELTRAPVRQFLLTAEAKNARATGCVCVLAAQSQWCVFKQIILESR